MMAIVCAYAALLNRGKKNKLLTNTFADKLVRFIQQVRAWLDNSPEEELCK